MPLIFNALVAGILAFALGWVWYGPFLGEQWRKAAGKEGGFKKPENHLLAVSFGGALAGAWIYGWIYLNMPQSGSFSFALMLAFMIWLAFFLPARAASVLYGGHARDLIWIDCGYQLASLFIYALVFSIL